MTSNRGRSEVVPQNRRTTQNEVVLVPSGPLGPVQGGNGNEERPRSKQVILGTTSGERPQRNVRGNSGDPNRGKWCTPKPVADAVGRFDHDPFSNPNSHIVSDSACWLERGDDGFGDGQTPGSYKIAATGLLRASSESRVWIQPPYSIVMRAFNHYRHTRWAALLRFDPRPEWFDAVYDAAEIVCVLREIQFEPPPGVKGGTNSFPHAIYYRHAEDATDEILKLCINWRKKTR